jgi:hypothetical protein
MVSSAGTSGQLYHFCALQAPMMAVCTKQKDRHQAVFPKSVKDFPCAPQSQHRNFNVLRQRITESMA